MDVSESTVDLLQLAVVGLLLLCSVYALVVCTNDEVCMESLGYEPFVLHSVEAATKALFATGGFPIAAE
jgi:hypothetical protein